MSVEDLDAERMASRCSIVAAHGGPQWVEPEERPRATSCFLLAATTAIAAA
jgi:hypothetical protein